MIVRRGTYCTAPPGGDDLVVISRADGSKQ
jgi:hypothetical protein